MGRVVRFLRCMGKPRLDMTTADRILAGTVDPADAPPGYEAVVALIAAARTPHTPAITVAYGRAPAPHRRRHFMLAAAPFRSRLTIAAAAATLALASGTAYATGLPAAASATARSVLHSLGVPTGPPAKTHSQPAGTHGAVVSSTARTTTATGAAKGAQIAAIASNGRSKAGRGDGASGTAKGSGHGHGAKISALAHSTTGTAGAKGATISAAASNGHSHAGQHGHKGRKGRNGGSQGSGSAGGHGGASGGHGPGSGHGGS